MEKRMYFAIPWAEVRYVKEALLAMEIPYGIEQPADRLHLDEGEVAFVFPDLHVRVYNHVRDLFGGHGRVYPE